MKKKITPQQNESNMQNANKGTNGTNLQYDKNQGNRGKQLTQTKKAKNNIIRINKLYNMSELSRSEIIKPISYAIAK